MRFKALIHFTLLAVACLGLAGCSSFPGVFKIDLHQGNFITQEMLDQLEPGMRQSQVLFILGSPMLQDTFNANRWDYYLSFQEGKKEPKIEHIIIHFDGNNYSHYTGQLQHNIELK